MKRPLFLENVFSAKFRLLACPPGSSFLVYNDLLSVRVLVLQSALLFTGAVSKACHIIAQPAPPDHVASSKICPIERAEFTAVLDTYATASKKGYQLPGLDPDSVAFQPGSHGIRILRKMWERAMASDKTLRDFQWQPGAVPVVQLQASHAAADRVQRATERAVLKRLMKTFEQAFCMRLTKKALVRGYHGLYCSCGCFRVRWFSSAVTWPHRRCCGRWTAADYLQL